jgi:hypothetical protein
MRWELVFREQGDEVGRKIVGADDFHPGETINFDGAWWRHAGDEPTGDPDLIRMFFEPAEEPPSSSR